MFQSTPWCPVCSFTGQMPNEERFLCTKCKGSGKHRCTHCLCLDCSGTGEIPCHGCEQGRVPCTACNGTGKPRQLLATGHCKQCDGTGLEYHETCSGAGELTCLTCAGIGSEGECDHCDGRGEMLCDGCYGAGLAPTQALLEHAEGGPLFGLVGKLQVADDNAPGTALSLPDACRALLAFLGNAHWDFGLDAQEREHEMNILTDRLHLRAAALNVSGNHVRVAYRFLTVTRVSETTFKVEYNESDKEWR